MKEAVKQIEKKINLALTYAEDGAPASALRCLIEADKSLAELKLQMFQETTARYLPPK